VSQHRPGDLAEQAFWDEEYLADVPLPSRPDMSMPFERCVARELSRHAPVERGASVLEVGCAPAKWLVFYAERFGARVSGVESSAKGAELSRANLRLSSMEGEIRHADFFALEAAPADLVLSLGFIEHFDDLERAFARHLEFVGPRGRLVIGVPNCRGVNGMLQRRADPAHLRLHNLEAMQPSLYRRLAAESGLHVDHLGYLGGFDPVIIKLGHRGAASAIVLLESLYRRLRVADHLNHRWLSSYLLAVLSRSGSSPPAR
jgi:SAM-dependent methyltransferase